MKLVVLFLCSLALALPGHAADFPPISDAERALDAVAGQPGAPAMVLFKKAELKLQDYPREISSYLKVDVRLKILTEEGKEFGEVEIPHSGFYRLRGLKGRTVLPNGQTLALPEDAIFEERRSRSLKAFITKLVFPAVEVGAILDYTYTVRWDHLFFLEPWYFHAEVPTRLSEIVYIKPENLALKPWGVELPGSPVKSESRRSAKGVEIRLWAENLPGIPSEPYGLAFNALSSRFMMVPAFIHLNGSRQPLLDSWESTCELFDDIYKQARRKDRQARKQAVSMAAGSASQVDKIAALHAYVRDEIQTELSIGVGISDDVKVDQVLADRRGAPIAKALLLQSMLSGIKVDSQMVWVADRTTERADLSVANPWWFDSALVRVEVDKEPIYLDPVDRSVGFGRLAPYYEGTQGVVFHKSKPQIVDLPVTPIEQNSRRVVVNLKVDDEGRVSGQGSQELEGHQAWRFLRWKDNEESTADAWLERLEQSFSGYDVSDVKVEEDIRQQQVRVGWSMRQRDEEVLGDEATLVPSLPLATRQPFNLPPEQRRTPVQMAYGHLDELVTTVRWPADWNIDAMPQEMNHEGPAGKIEWAVEHEESQGTMTVRRRFELADREFFGKVAYSALRELYDQAAKADALGLVLVRD